MAMKEQVKNSFANFKPWKVNKFSKNVKNNQDKIKIKIINQNFIEIFHYICIALSIYLDLLNYLVTNIS